MGNFESKPVRRLGNRRKEERRKIFQALLGKSEQMQDRQERGRREFEDRREFVWPWQI